MQIRQQQFRGKGFERPKDIFGGSLLKKGNPKTKRPLASKFAIHAVLKARRSAMRKPLVFKKVNEIVHKTARKHGVRIYQYANVGNHLHLLLKLPHVRAWRKFIRELAGRIAQLVAGFAVLAESFWLRRPFTRIVRSWKKAFQDCKEYVMLNMLEGDGLVDRDQIKSLKDLRARWQAT